MTNASTAHGREPFDTQEWIRAAGAGDADTIKSLLAAGADVDAVLEGGDTALLRATSKGHLQVVRILLDAGADPNAEREDGFGALTLAVFFGYTDIVRALLAGGADPSAKGRLGTTAEKWARFSGFDEIVEMLRASDPFGAQASAESAATDTGASTGETGTGMFFPTEGTFRPVVPLSKIDEALEASDRLEPSDSIRLEASDSISTAGQPAGVSESIDISGAVGEPAPEEQEETLVPLRVNHATGTRAVSHATRTRATPALSPTRTESGPWPRGVRRPWPVTAIAIALSVIAGLIAGTYLIGLKHPAGTQQSAPLAEDAAPAAVGTAQGTEVATQASESQSTTATLASDHQTPRPDPQSPEPNPAAEPDSTVDAVAHVVNAGEAGAKDARAKRDESAPKHVPPTSASESRDGHESGPPARGIMNADARLERTARTPGAGSNSSPEAKPAQRDASATTARRARVAEERLPAPASPRQSFPVSSPPPSAKSRKVIQWP